MCILSNDQQWPTTLAATRLTSMRLQALFVDIVLHYETSLTNRDLTVATSVTDIWVKTSHFPSPGHHLCS